MKSAITIVVPMYNRANTIDRMLDSVKVQTWRPLEVIVVDNNSTDNSRGVVEQWAADNADAGLHVRVIDCVPQGAAAARQAGLEAVDTEWVMFFDSDDKMRPGHVARVMEAVADNPEADILAWNILRHHLDGSTKLLRFINTDVLYNNIMHSSFATMNYMAKTDIVRRAGGWDPSTHMFDDCELGVRILALDPRIVHLGRDITIDAYDQAVSIMNSGEGRVASMMPALSRIREHLPEGRKHWADLQMLIMTQTWARGDSQAPALAQRLIAAQPWPRRAVFRIIARYLQAGGRGAARIYRLITAGKLYI